MIQQLRDIYKEIMVHEGASHDYLVMLMTYDKQSQHATIDMEKHIEGCIRDLEEEEPGSHLKLVATPATGNEFKTRDREVKKLSKKQAANFHATVARLLFVAKRGRLDILLLAVSFLTTRVREPDLDDWKKMSSGIPQAYPALSLNISLQTAGCFMMVY